MPMTFLAATGNAKDINRKPNATMWNYFCKSLNEELEIDKSKSFYCGDAAGRPATATRQKDHSADDYVFAANIGLHFHTPESLFLEQPLGLPQPKKRQSTLNFAKSTKTVIPIKPVAAAA